MGFKIVNRTSLEWKINPVTVQIEKAEGRAGKPADGAISPSALHTCAVLSGDRLSDRFAGADVCKPLERVVGATGFEPVRSCGFIREFSG